MHVIWRCEWGTEIFVECSGLNTELCMECKGLRTSSHPNTFEDMKLSTYLFPNLNLLPSIHISKFDTCVHLRTNGLIMSTFRIIIIVPLPFVNYMRLYKEVGLSSKLPNDN